MGLTKELSPAGPAETSSAGDGPRGTELIARSLYFSGLPPATIEKLAALTQVRSWPRSALIFSKGQKAEGFYLASEGRVKIYQADPLGKERIIKLIRPGEVFGEAAVFLNRGYPANALAVTGASALFWPAAGFRSLLKDDPDLSLALIGLLTEKLSHFASLVSSSLKEAVPRTAEYLLLLPHQDGRPELPSSKYLTAQALGMTPESLSRALGRLKRAGLIAENPRLTVIDRPGLAKAAAGSPLPVRPPKSGPDSSKEKA
jgi:CRP/FNR family transcriptional regulator